MRDKYFTRGYNVVSMTISLDDLDAKALEVLEAVYENGGEATTSEVKDLTGLEKNAIIHYRFDKMEEGGLVEVGRGDAEGNRLPPKKVVLTEEGQRHIQGGLFDEEEPTIVERMDRLERQFERVLDELEAMQDEFRHWKYDEEKDREVDVTDVMAKAERLSEQFGEVDGEAIEQAMAVEDRMTALEDRFSIKGKWAQYFDHVDAESVTEGGRYRSEYEVDGYDVMMAAYSGLDVDPPEKPAEEGE